MLLALWAVAIALLPVLVAQRRTPRDAVDWGSLHCPQDSTATLPTPTYGSNETVFTICTELTINAPLLDVYNAILDFNSYSRWNSFVYQVDVPSNVETPQDVYVGMPMVLHTTGLVPLTNTSSNEAITILDYADPGGYTIIAWYYEDGVGGLASRAEHPSILVDQGGGVVRHLSFETYYQGTLTPTIALLKDRLQAEFEEQAIDLKSYVEG
ncbi:hypothetical protein BJ170DRAFT_644516 [Xylariales sp. AK1849]|nr:hypothetical protein BJ170DRAFT_644516 [Xylariales sp. AK1849]